MTEWFKAILRLRIDVTSIPGYVFVWCGAHTKQNCEHEFTLYSQLFLLAYNSGLIISLHRSILFKFVLMKPGNFDGRTI